MRNEQGFAIPVEFSWKIELGGYRWVGQSGKRFLCPSDALERLDWPDPYDRRKRIYRPLNESTVLFREFAELDAAPTAIRDFGNRRGQLSDSANFPVKTEFGERIVHGDSFQDWKKEITDLKLSVNLWDAVTARDERGLVSIAEKLRRTQAPLAVQRQLHLQDADPVMTALAIIRNKCDARLSREVVSRLLFPGNLPRLKFSLEPQSLIGAIWLQFAVAIDVLKSYAKCALCGAPFEISRAPTTGKRTDARFCSDRCRVNNYRARIERARRMSATGRSRSEIARELQTQIQTIRRWVQLGKSSLRKP